MVYELEQPRDSDPPETPPKTPPESPSEKPPKNAPDKATETPAEQPGVQSSVMKPAPAPRGGDAADEAANDIEAGKPMAILCYVGNFFYLPVFVAPMLSRDNRFAMYHVRQGLGLWLAAMVLWSAMTAMWFLNFRLLWLTPWRVAGLGLVILNVVGIVNAASGKAPPVPLLGDLADRWFAGLDVPGAGRDKPRGAPPRE